MSEESFRASLAARLSRPLLLDPRAFDGVRAAGAFAPMASADAGTDQPYTIEQDVAVVEVRGPLAQRAWSCWCFEGDGYDSIQTRVQAALDDPSARAVVLALDSPGGEVAGCFEAVRAIRAVSKAAVKPIVAYADEMACSAAYALACATESIVVPDTGVVGSIGVIVSVVDESAAMETEGVRTHLVTSGARKADGHPAIPLSEESRTAIQAEVDHLAGVFFATVAEARGLSVETVRAMEAGVFLGSQAVKAGLADRVGNLADAIALAGDLAARTSRNGARRKMQSILEALGLGADATEADALLALSKIKTEHARLVEATGAPNAGEAEAEIRLWKLSHARVGELEAAEASRAARAAAEERAALLTKAFESGRLTAADRDDSESWVHTLPLEGLRRFATSGKQIVPAGRRNHEPGDEPSSEVASLLEKRWSALTADEKHMLLTRHPELARVHRAKG